MLDSLFPHGIRHYLLGGLIIGAGVSVIFVFTGAVAGMSTVFSSTWSFVSRQAFFQQVRFTTTRGWRLVLAAGLILGAFLWWSLLGPSHPIQTQVPWPRLLTGGVLVGLGARMSNGCTSGHGICGLASLEVPSLLAVLTFLATAIGTASLLARFGVFR
jgi:uncharacterized membrane protein YedE/YeeE